jgi:hypothetical protein
MQDIRLLSRYVLEYGRHHRNFDNTFSSAQLYVSMKAILWR